MAGKIITIDWQLIASLPSDKYHIKLLNKQQSAILLALCEYQHWASRWDNLDASQHELDRFMGDIEFRLMGDDGMATVDDIKQGICEGVLCAMEESFKRFLSGKTTGFSIDENGDVVVGGGGASVVPLPEDDEDTPWDESAAAEMGGAVAVKQAIKLYFDRIDTSYGSVNGTPINSVATTQAMIEAYFPVDSALLNAALTDYYAYRAANNRHVFTPLLAFDLFLFCKGSSNRTFVKWLYDVSGYAAAKQAQMALLIGALTDEFYSSYMAEGVKVPSLDYPQSQCYPTPDEEWEFNMASANDVVYTLANSLKFGHRYRFSASGTFVDADVPNVVKDAFWSHDLVTGIKTFENMTWSIGGITAPTSAKIPFAADHVYVFTIDKDNNGSTNGGTITKTNGAFTLPNVTGIIEMAVNDEGEYAI